MKKHNYIAIMASLIAMVIISLSFFGCKQNEDPDPGPLAVVLKFKNPDYKNYILANYFEGQDKILGMRYYSCEEPIGQTGYSPYWELPNDWLLVDWNWRYFPYNAGLTLLTELTWDKFEIDTTNNSGIPSWPLTEPHLFQPVEQILYINAIHLENYCGVKLPLDLIPYLWGKTPEYYSPCENPAKMDSLWTILQEKLTFAIENGDLEHINDEKYNPYNK